MILLLIKQERRNYEQVQLGGSSGQTGVRVKSLTVDCLSKTGCIGVENMFSGEGSTVEDVAIDNAPKYGLHVVIGDPVHGLYAAYSGPYRNITVQYPSCGSCGSSVGVLVECLSSDHINCVNGESPVVVHFDNITASAIAEVGLPMGFEINGVPAILTNSHFENYQANVQIGTGGTQSTHNVKIENVSMSNGVGVVIATKSSNILLIGLGGPGGNYNMVTNKYPNDGNGIKTLTQFLGFYMLGTCTSDLCTDEGNLFPALVTSDPFTQWQAPKGWTQ